MKRILLSILVFAPGIASADKVFSAGKGATWDCKKDPTVSIAHGKGKYTFKGACTSINVSGGSNTLTIESVDELNLSGAKNTVTVGTVGAINLVGAKNKVTWKAAKTGDAPAISHVGKDNVVVQAGGAAPAKTPPATAPTAPATAPAAPVKIVGTAIDCAKSAVFNYVDNDGTFTLTGKCDKIMISGNNNKVFVDSVNNVMLSGNDNTVEARAAEVISTSGNNNKVSYKTAVGAKTKVMNTGNGNKITQVK